MAAHQVYGQSFRLEWPVISSGKLWVRTAPVWCVGSEGVNDELLSKASSLAEVAAALPEALSRQGHEVTLVLPRYRGIDTAGSTSREVVLSLGGRRARVTLHEHPAAEGVTLVFVDAPELFDRAGLYGDASGDYPDNAWRFAVFARAALEQPRLSGVRPSSTSFITAGVVAMTFVREATSKIAPSSSSCAPALASTRPLAMA